MKTRVIPVLLLRGRGLYKTVRFKNPGYVGDPINSVKIFNEKEVDELAILDIAATPEARGPDFEMIEQIAGEAFMPMAYGGGLTTLDQIGRVLSIGFEKVILNAATFDRPEVVREAARVYGSQSIVGCIDVRRTWLGRYEPSSHSGARRRSVGLEHHVKALEQLGVGEILVNDVDRDGTGKGYDLALLKAVSSNCSVPVIACGGAATLEHLEAGVKEGGASAVAAGSMFVYKGVHRAVLINYPDRDELERRLP
jgi:imidazole glycerol-phosphate synthase subunit HisF